MSCERREEACRSSPVGREGLALRLRGRLTDWQGLAHLAPQEHVAKHDLQPVEEVVSDDNDGGASRGPALPGADGLDAGGGSWEAGEDPVKGLYQGGD